jgi:perosamine synthetase
MSGVKYSIPWAMPQFWGRESEYVVDALSSTWISGGPYVDRLEAECARYLGTPHAIATSNGTTALHLAYLALGIGPGDEVIVPGFAFMAAANVALHLRATPVFADVDPESWCLTAAHVRQRLSARTKAVVPVHTYGNVCDMQPLLALAAEHDVAVIEDAAEAFGSRYRGQMAGTLGTLGTYSLHATKTITTGEGGLVVTSRDDLLRPMRLYRSHGVGERRYWHEVPGHNFRLTNLQAALGCAQLEQIGRIRDARRRMFASYARHLGGMPGVRMQHFAATVDAVPWVVTVELDPEAFPRGRDAIMAAMAERGIETRPGFYDPSRMPHLYQSVALPNSERISAQVLALPSFPALTDAQIESVCARLDELRA